MTRIIKLAAAQVGAINRDADRKQTLSRLLSLLTQAAAEKVQLVVFPECTLTTFFPRHLIHSQTELDSFFESSDDITTAPDTKALFEKAVECGIDIVLGYAERTKDGKGYNTCIYFSAQSGGKVISRYRKVHLPGTVEPFDDPTAINQLEKRYFTPGDLGFQAFRAPGLLPKVLKKGDQGAPDGKVTEKQQQSKGDPVVGMMICNDRRWPEAWRTYALQGAELILYGYNTGSNLPHLWGTHKTFTPEEAEKEALFHSTLVQQSNSYMNACFSVSAARCGMDDGKYGLIAGSMICDHEGHVVAEAKTKGDELVVAEVDLEECWQGKNKTFDFERHRRIEHYDLIGSQTAVVEPELLE